MIVVYGTLGRALTYTFADLVIKDKQILGYLFCLFIYFLGNFVFGNCIKISQKFETFLSSCPMRFIVDN